MEKIQNKNIDNFIKFNAFTFDKMSSILQIPLTTLSININNYNNSLSKSKLISDLIDILDLISLIYVGITNGYFPKNIKSTFSYQIIRFLEVEPIREFYSLNNRYYLMDAITSHIFSYKNNNDYLKLENTSPIKSWTNFNKFYILSNNIKYDLSITNFLDFIDNYDTISGKQQLEKIKSSLNSIEALDKYLNFEETEDDIIEGALIFANSLIELESLILNNEIFPLFQSSIWHYYGYYYGNRKDAFLDFYNFLFARIYLLYEKSNLSKEINEDIIYNNYGAAIIENTRKSVIGFARNEKIPSILKQALKYQEDNMGIYV